MEMWELIEDEDVEYFLRMWELLGLESARQRREERKEWEIHDLQDHGVIAVRIQCSNTCRHRNINPFPSESHTVVVVVPNVLQVC